MSMNVEEALLMGPEYVEALRQQSRDQMPGESNDAGPRVPGAGAPPGPR